MADLGDVGLVMYRTRPVINCRNSLTLLVQPTGNGPITNSGLTASTPNGLIVLSHSGGAQVERVRANSAGLWSFYDLSIGRYTAVDVTTNGQWFIDVAADGTFTVTENPGAPVTVAYAFA